MLGRSMNFFLLVIWEDGRDRLEKSLWIKCQFKEVKGAFK